MSTPKQLLIAIVGPNASGKTALAIKLAKRFNGEIISADSRQVFRGMDIGTGKATKAERQAAQHYLLDVASPRSEFNVVHFKRTALKAIRHIHARDKLPFLVGGTGFWISAITDGVDFPNVKPNKTLRARLGKRTPAQLYAILKKLDPQRAKTIDCNNPYRLIRAIEIIQATKRPIKKIKKNPPFNVLFLGAKRSRKELYNRIDKRLRSRMRQGLIAEVRNLHENGISWKRLYDFGLEYRYVSLFLQAKLTKSAMLEQLSIAIKHYAKRQMTWFQRNKRIGWIASERQAAHLIQQFLDLESRRRFRD
ncbi:MAG: tRNA (adenosine(37)-N6)-dimethylallyltransferase MiaA [Patescibacteria group bacterium]|nr:tRNA (adenosine(37)-N6)-dimethylallyltransferase MiaA [Patescibacteria group bacterium]MDD5716084.1 tRNA (adenosine(37)-N6)-dimethylallyltransferase MiaA [Patescibacteria group bacterium]